ncbi:MAG: hypothetical protein CMG62_10820 [Candidatus Marinimicrobia bacterium]|nr:hypothetical protein [Candidatus Neomarinimicrobiota bacterium]|tara:strand:+ start:7190 stop:8185 length:996 start_codon:yes stop_codon:yes gene_type:complete
MKKASSKRQKIKFLLTKIFSSSLIDSLRNLLSIRHKFFYSRRLKNKVLKLIDAHHGEISSNLDLLKELHNEFETIDLKNNYKFESLLTSSRQRFNYLKEKKIGLKGKKVADFGAGHGDSLFLCKELGFSRAVGLDFSDKDFIPHQEDLDEDVFSFIDFRTLDLVKDPLGIKDFDLITSFSAFEHFDDPKAVLDKCYESLAKGGHLYTEFAAFNSPYATHRKKFSGVPHIQNIFNEEVSFNFFYDYLKINNKINRYTGEKILDGNPYPEVNRYLIEDYEKIFLDKNRWEVIEYTKIKNYQYHWFIDCFRESFKDKNKDFLYVDYLKFLIKKK